MSVRNALSLLVGAAGISAFVASPLERVGQVLLGSGSAGTEFKCDLPPMLDPSGDGLPAAKKLFSSKDALNKQVERHQAIVRVPSVCFDDLGEVDEDERWKPFYDLHDALAKTYPTVHKVATLEKVNTFGLVYTIKGSDSSLKPVLLAAHQDVVPVADESTWKYPPFDAYFDGEYLWGRGSSDDKNSMTGLMSAMETLLSNPDWTPKRTIVLAFGFDEECSGYRGAGHIATHLEDKYGRDSFSVVLDEGGLGMQQMGDVLYAMPAVMEKGHVDVWFELHVVGGHSSVPFPHTGIGIMSEITTALEAKPYGAELLKDSPVHRHMMCQARYSPDEAPELTHFINKGDLDGAAKAMMKMDRWMQFMIGTSQSVDYISGGQKINAMPEVITLGVNYRVAPQDSIPKVQHNVVKYIKDIVAKYDIKVKAFEGDEEYQTYAAAIETDNVTESPEDIDYQGTLIIQAKEKSEVAPVSPTTGPVWDTFSGTLQHAFKFEGGTVVPAGEIMTGNTDTRHYLELSRNVYRFTPVRLGNSDGVHTINERIRMEGHMEILQFYYEFIRNFNDLDA